jgi:Xaa-Pro aminopeptidase
MDRTINRRDVVAALAGGTAAAAVPGSATAADTAASPGAAAKPGSTIALARPGRLPGVDGRMLVNKPRAYQVLEQYGLDGLVAANPVNVYYLSNTMPIGMKMRWEYPAFATFARDSKQPSFLVTTSAQAWDLVNGDREVPELIAYSSAANWQDYAGAPPEKFHEEPKASVGGYLVREGATLTPREQRWAASQKRYNTSAAPTPAWGLVRALRESGLAKGRVGVDDMRVKYLLEQIGFTGVQLVPGDGVFRMIRMVKSEPEIALMRIAGRNNGEAAMRTIRSIERGMRLDDVERRFRAETAALGNDMTFIIAGVTLGSFADGEAVPGKAFLVDAVSRFREYHGDFARTVCIGDPPPDVLARAQANRIGREAVFEIIRPGTKFSDMRRVAREAMVKAGMPEKAIVANPHSVGLQHTDHPNRLDIGLPVPLDHVLEENMTITMDLPYIEVGWGAGHNEDLIRITRTGYEPLNEESDPLVVV